MVRVGGLTHKFYTETRGVKVSGGQWVKGGTILTRNGDKWQPGENVIGQMSLSAKCDGEVYFSRRKSSYRNRRVVTVINIRPGAAPVVKVQ